MHVEYVGKAIFRGYGGGDNEDDEDSAEEVEDREVVAENVGVDIEQLDELIEQARALAWA